MTTEPKRSHVAPRPFLPGEAVRVTVTNGFAEKGTLGSVSLDPRLDDRANVYVAFPERSTVPLHPNWVEHVDEPGCTQATSGDAAPPMPTGYEEAIASRYAAGDSIGELELDYNERRDVVERAIRRTLAYALGHLGAVNDERDAAVSALEAEQKRLQEKRSELLTAKYALRDEREAHGVTRDKLERTTFEMIDTELAAKVGEFQNLYAGACTTIARLESELAEATATIGGLIDQSTAALARVSVLEGQLAKAKDALPLAIGDSVFVWGNKPDARTIQSIVGAQYRLNGGGIYPASKLMRAALPAAPSAQPTPSPSDDKRARVVRRVRPEIEIQDDEALPAATPGVSACQSYVTCDAQSEQPEDHHRKCPMSRESPTTDEPAANALPVDHNSGRVRASFISGDSRASDGGGQRLSEPDPGSGETDRRGSRQTCPCCECGAMYSNNHKTWCVIGKLPGRSVDNDSSDEAHPSEPEAQRAVVVGSRWWFESDSAPALVIVDEVRDDWVSYHERRGSAVYTVAIDDWRKRFSFSSNPPAETTGEKL